MPSECRCPWVPKRESSPGLGVTDGLEPLDVGAGN